MTDILLPSSSSTSTPTTDQIREYYINNYCNDDEVQKVRSVQSLCGTLPTEKWPFWSNYFGFWTHLGSGPFYILLLCLFAWTGHPLFAAYLCTSLSLTLYTTDVIKDSLALPRPPSPPVLRGGQASHALEYGFPSTHTACACVLAHIIARFFIEHLGMELEDIFLLNDHHEKNNNSNDNDNNSQMMFYVIVFCAFIFTVKVSASRMYLGLHWYGDVLGGLTVYFTWAVADYVILREAFSYILGHVPMLVQVVAAASATQQQNSSNNIESEIWEFLLVYLISPFVWFVLPLLVGVWMIEIHATPRDACPCFEDSVRFMGADSGLVLGSWTTIVYYYYYAHHQQSLPSSTSTTTSYHHEVDHHQQVSTQSIFVRSDLSSSLNHQIPSFTLAALHNTFGFILLYIVGVVLLILAQEISVKYILPPLLKPLLRFVSGQNTTLSNSNIFGRPYRCLVWFVGSFVFLRVVAAESNSSASSSAHHHQHRTIIGYYVSKLFFGNRRDDYGDDGENKASTTVERNDKDGTTVITVVQQKDNLKKNQEHEKRETLRKADDTDNEDDEHSKSDIEPSQSQTSSHATTSNVCWWTLRCHTHWDEESVQAKFSSYVVLGFCASFVWPQFLFPGIVQAWLEIAEAQKW